MFKVFVFARRRSELLAMSHAEYIDFYEKRHVPLLASLIRDGHISPLNQRRNYVLHNETINLNLMPYFDYDVVITTCYLDRQSYESTDMPKGAEGGPFYDHDSQPLDLRSRRYLFAEEREGGIPTVESKGEKHFKLLMFARRRPDLAQLSHDEYIEFYETKRVPIARKAVESGLLPPYIDQRRNYVFRSEPTNLNLTPYFDFDAILEATYKDRDTFESTHRAAKGAANATLYKDESQPFDLSSRRYLAVEERFGGLPPTP